MGRDELCSLSAIRPYGGGPLALWSVDHDEAVVAPLLLANLLSSPRLPRERFSDAHLAKIVKEILSTYAALNQEVDRLPWRPDSTAIATWDEYEDMRAIGNFHGMYAAASFIKESGADGSQWSRYPNGREIAIRKVHPKHLCDDCSFLYFWDENEHDWVEAVSNVGPGLCNPNFFCCNVWLEYLKAWIRWDALPPRSNAFPDDPDPMSVEGELYEIVNSRETRRGSPGALPFIDYGGLEYTLDQWQFFFLRGWNKRTPFLERAIRDGLSGEELMPALARDMGVWQCTRTDIWPSEPIHFACFDRTGGAGVSSPFHRMPAEIVLAIVSRLDPPDLVSLMALSRGARHLFLSSGILDGCMCHRIVSPTGDLRWLLPVPSMPKEEAAFVAACEAWLPVTTDPTQGTKPMVRREFPHWAFVAKAWMDDSMRNRRRIWSVVKQLEALWYDYRANGWKSDKFTFVPNRKIDWRPDPPPRSPYWSR